MYISEMSKINPKISFSFGKRRIQKSAYSFMCPLPAAWAKDAKLDQSSTVKIELLEDGSLKICPVPATHQDEGTRAPITT
jgi:antitoxin MazE